MNRILMIICALLLTMSAQAQENNYTIKADVSDLIKYYEGQEKELSDSIYLLDITTQKPVTEKIALKDPTKIELSGYVDSPKIIHLIVFQTFEGWICTSPCSWSLATLL